MNYILDCSIVIPVKNGEKYIIEALTSCINQQTKYKYEILVCNDNSTDKSISIIKSFILSKKNNFIKLYNVPSTGLVSALNFGVSKASSNIILRLDQDDLMLKDRIKLQVDYLNLHPNTVLVGSQIKIFGERSGKEKTKYLYPNDYKKIIRKLPFSNCFAHPSVAFKKDAFIKAGGYRSGTDGCEDYDLWLRMIKIGKAANLNKILTAYRTHNEQHSYNNKTIILKKKIATQYFIFTSDKYSLNNKNKGNNFLELSKTFLLISILLHVFKLILVILISKLKFIGKYLK